MTDHITTITDLIDAALDGNNTQRTTEASYGTDVGGCWRCAEPAADDSPSGLCDACRAYLLEDSDTDPVGDHWSRADLQVTVDSIPATERWGVAADRTVGWYGRTYELTCTCSAAPEQYDVYCDGNQVGYIRLRGGRFRVDHPECGGEVLLSANYSDIRDDVFGPAELAPDERFGWLMRAVSAIDMRLRLLALGEITTGRQMIQQAVADAFDVPAEVTGLDSSARERLTSVSLNPSSSETPLVTMDDILSVYHRRQSLSRPAGPLRLTSNEYFALRREAGRDIPYAWDTRLSRLFGIDIIVDPDVEPGSWRQQLG